MDSLILVGTRFKVQFSMRGIGGIVSKEQSVLQYAISVTMYCLVRIAVVKFQIYVIRL